MKWIFAFILFNTIQAYGNQIQNHKPFSEHLDSLKQVNPNKVLMFIDQKILNQDYRNNSALGELLYYRGISCIILNNFSQAQESLNLALSIAEKTGNYYRTAKINQALGILYNDILNSKKASEYNQKALNIFYDLKDSVGVFNILNNQAVVNIKNEKYLSAIDEFQAASQFSTTPLNLLVTYSNIGSCYNELDSLDQAYWYYSKANIEVEKIHSYYHEVGIKLNLSRIFLKLGNIDSASFYNNKAMVIVTKHSFKSEKLSVLKTQAEIFTANGEHKRANKIYTEYETLNDSINNAANLTKIYQNEFDRLKVNKNKEISSIQNFVTKSKIVLVVILIFGVLLFGLFFILLKKYLSKVMKRKNELLFQTSELKNEIDFKNKELTSYATYIDTKNSLLKKLKKELSQKKGTESFKLVRQNLDLDKNRKDFHLRIENIKDSFFFKIKQKHTDLTERELQICVLLNVGMTSKEMAESLHLSLEGINKARYRLRKKLRLNTSDSLKEYIKKI